MMIRMVGLAGAVLAAPVMAAAAIALKLEAWDEPVLFRQRRITRGGREFDMLKLRTMAGEDCFDWLTPEHRVTPIGRFLRRFKLDELPQLLNVARGEMTFVGPRPVRVETDRRMSRVSLSWPARHVVLPGLTGLAQVSLPAPQSVEDNHRRLALDLAYIADPHPWRVAWRTFVRRRKSQKICDRGQKPLAPLVMGR